MPQELLLSGATGFIGSSLLQKWLDSSDARITLLVRPKRGSTPPQRVRQLLEQLPGGGNASALAERITIVEGDLSQSGLGLSDADAARLADTITQIVHCGAAARFDLPLADARRTNCGGAQGILDLALRCSNLARLDYVGTAYVAGKRRGLIREEELDEGQEHNNSYEQSKLEAEQLVRAARDRLPIAIHRPTIVVADSRTGHASPVSAFFRMLKMYAHGLLEAVPGDSATTMDLVSLDYTADAMFAIAQDPQAIGNCFHVSAGLGNQTTLGEIAELASHHFGRQPFAVIPPEAFQRQIRALGERLSEEARAMLSELELYAPYLAGGWQFDNSNTVEALRGSGLSVPPVSSYFGKMVACVRQQG